MLLKGTVFARVVIVLCVIQKWRSSAGVICVVNNLRRESCAGLHGMSGGDRELRMRFAREVLYLRRTTESTANSTGGIGAKAVWDCRPGADSWPVKGVTQYNSQTCAALDQPGCARGLLNGGVERNAEPGRNVGASAAGTRERSGAVCFRQPTCARPTPGRCTLVHIAASGRGLICWVRCGKESGAEHAGGGRDVDSFP